ncbi:MBL fold metallo-hydrolase [Pseudonocardia sp. GCM10023141]|uniref:MBL fold metallo-hydrolase n=1 Tax=Pseudonocardia sp. GCM10023141 TaxID=3252653 RepID=UPI00361A200F
MTTSSAIAEVHDLGRGCHAWLQRRPGWGRSNTGLIVGHGESLLVDTLFDIPLTTRMLDDVAPLLASAPLTVAVNTHGNGDHWFGNRALADVEIVAATATVADMRAVGPAEVTGLMSLPTAAGRFAGSIFAPFDIAGVAELGVAYPTRTFDGELDLVVGGVDVQLIDVGPAHTGGDTIVHVPDARTVYAGDIVFAGATPIAWNGPIANWIAACRRIVALAPQRVVPGHGPVIAPGQLQAVVEYLEFVTEQATVGFRAGWSFEETAARIDLGRYTWLPERERLAVNVHTVYRELDPTLPALAGPELFGCMAALDTAFESVPTPDQER